MNAHNRNDSSTAKRGGKRLLSILLCLVMLFTMNGAAAGALVEPMQAAAATVGAAVGNAVSGGLTGIRNAASGLSVRFGNAFTRFSNFLLSLDPPDGEEPDPEPVLHALPEVFWNSAPDDVIDTDTQTVILKGGSDDNDGDTALTPVLTYEKALSLVAPGGKIWVMTQETVSGEGVTRDGTLEGAATVLDYYTGNTSLFHVENGGLYLSGLDMQDNNPDADTYRRLALLDKGAIRIGENTVFKGNLEIELFKDDLQPLIYVDEEAVDGFASDVQLEFRFGIDETTYFTVDRDLNAVDLVSFPEGTDASAYLNNITLHASLHDPSMSCVWKTRVKLGFPNIIQAYLVEPYDGAIYISGFGNDANDGMYPDTPVKTFDRAVAILTGTAADSAEINVFRQEHGGYHVKEGVIRIVGAPVEPADGEIWTMPADTYWHDANNNTVTPAWAERYKNYTGALVSVENGTFTLTDITIKGNKAQVADAVGSIIEIGEGGSVTLSSGALLTENHAENGGGVTVNGAGAQFSLSGGSITKCEAANGGGIYAAGGTVNIGSGVISGNTATNGGGIYSRTSYLEMTGGEIKSNNAANGAGVYVARDENDETDVAPSFRFSGGAIKSNTASGNGGGVYLAADPAGEGAADYMKVELTANGEGEGILSNTAANGGGVCTCGNFTVYAYNASAEVLSAAPGWYSTAKVTGNNATASGGGWFANGVDFTIDGGEITGNSGSNGGGISLNNAAFTMQNGATVHDNISQVGSGEHRGGGVYMVSARAFRLYAGCEIYNNKFYPPNGDYYGTVYGGGVYVGGSKASDEPSDDFLIEGEIHDNRLEHKGYAGGGWHTSYYLGNYKGCGAYFDNLPLKINGGKIYNNTGYTYIGDAHGAGLYHNNGKLLICGNAEIYGNLAEVNYSASYSDYRYGYIYGSGLTKCGGTLMVDGAEFHDNAMRQTSSSSNPCDRLGGGICLDTISSATITNARFENNGAGVLSGGALAVSSSQRYYSTPNAMNGTVTVTDTQFVNNSAAAGGAVYVEVTRQSTFTNCTFTGNRATSTEGGALNITDRNVLEAMAATVDGCVFQNNTAATNAGAILLGGTSSSYALNVTVTNSTFGGDAAEQGNSCNGNGGAIVNSCANLTLGNGNVIKNNVALNGGGIYNGGGTLTLSATEDGTPTVVTANTAANGAGIYNNSTRVNLYAADLTGNANGDDVKGTSVYNNTGTIYLDASAVDLDGIYLNARLHPVVLTGAPAETWECEMDLNVTEGDAKFAAGDTVVTPGSPLTDTAPYEDNFILIRSAAAAYNLVAVSPNLVLAPRAVYIDGVAGDDANSGAKPTKAVKTFAAAREKLTELLNANPKADKLIYVVNTVTVSGTEVWTFAGDTMPAVDEEGELTGEEIPISGVKLLAYCPEGTPFSAVQTSMVLVNGEGDLTMEGLTVNANRASFSARCPQFGVRLTGTEEAPVSLTVKNNAAIEDDMARFTNCYAAVYAKYGNVTFDHVKLDNNDCSAEKKTGNTVENMRNTYGAGVTVHYGTFTADHVDISGCTAYTYGAGVFLNHATAEVSDLTAKNCTLTKVWTLQSYSNYDSYIEGASVHGGCIYSVDTDLTLSDSAFSKCVSKVGGTAVSILRGSLTATDVSFTENGILETQYVGTDYKGNAGVLQIAGAATAELTGVTFANNTGVRGAALRVETSGGSPNVTVRGGAFTNNYSYHGGGAIYALGANASNMPTVTILPDTRGETPVRTQFTGNSAYQNFGAIGAIETNLSITDADFSGNYISNIASSISSRMTYTGGSAVLHRRGSFAMSGCTVSGNSITKGTYGSCSNNTYGAVVTLSAPSASVENCSFTNNKMTGGGNFSLVGCGLTVSGCPDFHMQDCSFTGNVITETGTGGSVNGAGMYLYNGTAVIEDCEFNDNKFTVSNPKSVYLRGAAIYATSMDITLTDITAVGNTAANRDVIRFNNSTRIRMGGDIVMDGATENIVLFGNTKPIELIAPLGENTDGENSYKNLSLSFDESFIGKPVVKGYTEEFASPELDADVYLPESASPRFIEGPEPIQQQLRLIPGEGEYDHDIVVGTNHVYLSSSGVDDEAHGNAPETPVKTFAYAKQRLQSRMAGANIIIVNNGVTVSGSESWTLEEVTDSAGNTWQPVIERYMNPNDERSSASGRYTGVMVTVAEGGELELENITVNGCYGRTNVRVNCGSILKTYGTLSIGSGAHITNNIADYGALLYVAGGEACITEGALLDYGYGMHNGGSISGCYGCGAYINGGNLTMTGGEISACGPQYYSLGSGPASYGALVALQTKGVFRFTGGVLRDARVYGGYASSTNGYGSTTYNTVYGAIYINGSQYNAEAGTGVLFDCHSEIRDNFYVQNYTSLVGNFNGITQMIHTTVSLNGGTAVLGDGTLITHNFCDSSSGWGRRTYLIYVGGGSLLKTEDGAVIRDNTTDNWYNGGYTHSYCIYNNGGTFMMNGGDISDVDASYLIYLNGGSFIMNGGELHPSTSNNKQTTAVYQSSGSSTTLNGGKIWAPAGKGEYGVNAASSGSVTINGDDEKYGEIYGGFKAGVMMNGQNSFTMNGGKIHDINYDYGVGVRGDGGSTKTMTFNGGEIYNCFRGVGLWQANTTATFNKCKIHDNRYYGIGMIGTPTVNITSDNVEIYNNALHNNGESHGIYANNGTLKITGGLIHDNKIGAGQENPGTSAVRGGGIFVGSDCTSATIKNCSVYNNYCTDHGGGIAVNSNKSKTVTIENCEIYNNESKNNGGGFFEDSSNTSGPLTYNFVFNNVKIYGNKAGNGGGGAVFGVGNTAEQTLNVSLNDCKIYNNTSLGTTGGGGLHIYNWGDDSSSTKLRTINAAITGCEIYQNTTSASGGGINVWRNASRNVKINVDLSASTVVRNNTAANSGGGVNASSSTAFSAADNVVQLSDAVIRSNTADNKGGGVNVSHAKLIENNTQINKNTAGTFGGGFAADQDADVMLTQGRLEDNTAANGNGAYVGKANVKFMNNYLQTGANDDFYLAYESNPLLMYKSFTNLTRVYKVYPSEEYVAGDIVVHPTGLCPRSDPYLRNFISVRPGTVLERQYPDIILGRIIFLDGETGLDPVIEGDTITYLTDDLGVLHDGTAPDKAFATFAASKHVLGTAPGCIYVSGPVEIAADETWSLGEKQYMRRYCGFTIAGGESYDPFMGDMFTVTNGTLTLENITVQGVYNAAEDFTADGSIFVLSGGNLNVASGARILDNRATVNGSGVRIETGAMDMTGGEISGNTYTGPGKGGGIYQGDTLTLSGDSLKIADDIYLAAANGSAPDRVISIPALDFAPAEGSVLHLLVQRPNDGRDVVVYPEGTEPGDTQKQLYDLSHDPDLAGQYIIDNEPLHRNVLELRLPYQIYLDGVNGSDLNDGETPETAVRSVKRAYELIGAQYDQFEGNVSGGLIHVVDTVTVSSAMALSDTCVTGGETADAKGHVTFKRYAQPDGHASLTGFEKPTNVNALFTVANGGELTLAGVTVDGHSFGVPSGSEALISSAVTAEAALIVVEEGGAFTLSGGRLQNALSTANAGAITVNEGGTASVTGGSIANALNTNGVGIYQDGVLNLSGSPAVSGAVYLAKDANYVNVPAAFAPANAVELRLNRAFDGRDLARYDTCVPGETERLHWTLSEDILLNYAVRNAEDDAHMLELRLKEVVYIDGINGNDTRDGTTPEKAVKTLKRAYTLLSAQDGSTIYVVNTVTISTSAMLDHNYYITATDELDAGGDVQFIRYAQPEAYNEEDPGELLGFGKPSCTGALIAVPGGLSLAVNGVSFDGHSYAVSGSVSRYNAPGVTAADALLRVNEGGSADISDNTVLQYNNNSGNGGAIANFGTVLLGGVTVANNSALHGSGVYQSGTLKVDGTAHPDVAADQSIYLTGAQGAADERLITVTGALDDGSTLTVDLADPVHGRNIAQFTNGAFDTDVTHETDHFVLAFDAENQFDLVKSADAAEPDTLELGHIHVWTGPVWTWTSHEDANHITVYDTATATFTCSRCGDTADVTDEDLDIETLTAPGCETSGSKKYTAIVTFEGETYTDFRTATLPATGHDWEFKGFTWTGNDTDGYTAAVANYKCLNDENHTRTVNAVVTSAGNMPTCETGGTMVYTAAVTAETSLDGLPHEDQKTVTLEALGHDWGAAVWNWTEAVVDGETVFTRVTCTVPCNRDHAHDLVYATDFEGAMHVTLTETERTPAGCTTAGSVKYVATVDAKPDLTDSRTVVLPATGHDWDFDNIEWTWTKVAEGDETVWNVTATVTCRNNPEHKWTENATVTGPEVITPAGEFTPGEQKYTAKVTFTDETGSYGPYYDYKTEPIPPYGHTHEWTGPVWTWTSHEDANHITVYDTATATFTCACGSTEARTDTELAVVTVPAKCEEAGSAEYTAEIEFNGVTYTDSRTVTLPALGHNWEFVDFTWTGSDETGYTAAVANYVCSHDPTETRTVDAVVTSATTDPTCLQTGKTVYTAVVSAESSLDGKRHTEDKTVVIPTVDHNWHGPAWTWTEKTDGTWDAAAVFTCDVTDPAHIELPPVTVTYEETVHPTVDLPGKGVYTAVTVFNGVTYTDTKEVDIDPLGHKFVGPEWTWFGSDEEGWEAEATFTCINETGHIEKPPVTMTNEITRRPTCEGTGTKVYTATTVFEGKTYTATKDVTLPPIGHDWGEPEGVWHGKDITVTVTCRNDPSHVRILDADVTETVITPPWCTTEGLSHLTATVEYNGNTYTWEKEYVLPALGHNWGPWVVVREATFEQDGLERRECLRCGLVEERVIPWNGEANREIQFVVSFPMHYVAYIRSGEYYVFSDTTPVIYWYEDQPLKFRVEPYTTWSVSGYIVAANGHALRPDANGDYTIPAGTERVVINCDPTTAPTQTIDELRCPYCGNIHPDTVWGFLIGLVHKLFAMFKR